MDLLPNIQKEQKDITPLVGMGLTEYVGSDRYTFTVVKVLTPNRIIVKEDNVKVVKGTWYDGNVEVEYELGENSPEIKLYRTRDKRCWKRVGSGSESYTPQFYLGYRSYYQDPSF